jgi:hypothetical protein
MREPPKPLAEDWFGYWEVRIRNPKLFTKIRTPDWSSHAATIIAKKWIISAAQDFQVAPQLVSESSLTNLKFVRRKPTRNRSPNENEDQVHARQGQLLSGRWVTQSVLIPQGMILNGIFLDIPSEVAHEIACYIARRLDRNEQATPCLMYQRRY